MNSDDSGPWLGLTETVLTLTGRASSAVSYKYRALTDCTTGAPAQLDLISKSVSMPFVSSVTSPPIVSSEMVGKEEPPGPPSVVAFHAGIVMHIFLAPLSSHLQTDLPLP